MGFLIYLLGVFVVFVILFIWNKNVRYSDRIDLALAVVISTLSWLSLGFIILVAIVFGFLYLLIETKFMQDLDDKFRGR